LSFFFFVSVSLFDVLMLSPSAGAAERCYSPLGEFSMSDEQKKELPFWKSKKFAYLTLVIVALVVLALTGTVAFTSEQVVALVQWMLALVIGGHAATDIASMFKK
jgi:hypothetical protein